MKSAACAKIRTAEPSLVGQAIIHPFTIARSEKIELFNQNYSASAFCDR